MPPRGDVVTEVRFDPKLKTYVFWQGVIALVASIVGIVVLPFWLLLGRAWARRSFEAMSCVLTDRALVLRQGVWFRSESTVPLDRIQDVSVRHGPILDRLGLATIRVDTAGMSGGSSSGISLTGVVGTAAFRDRVLEARDRAAGWADGEGPAAVGAGDDTAVARTATDGAAVVPDGEALLREIRDSLGRIETLLARRRGEDAGGRG